MGLNEFWETAIFIESVLKDKQEEHCFIKTYGGDTDYFDNNIDLVIQKDKEEFFEEYLEEKFFIEERDYKKMRFYERNKLMCSPRTAAYVKIHLHDNVGWHDTCFINSNKLFNSTRVKKVNGIPIVIPNDQLEKEIFFLHSFFEKHHFSEKDLEFIGKKFLMTKLKEYNITNSVFDEINFHKSLRLKVLLKVWFRYYRLSKEARLYNYLLHMLLFFKQKITD